MLSYQVGDELNAVEMEIKYIQNFKTSILCEITIKIVEKLSTKYLNFQKRHRNKGKFSIFEALKKNFTKSLFTKNSPTKYSEVYLIFLTIEHP